MRNKQSEKEAIYFGSAFIYAHRKMKSIKGHFFHIKMHALGTVQESATGRIKNVRL